MTTESERTNWTGVWTKKKGGDEEEQRGRKMEGGAGGREDVTEINTVNSASYNPAKCCAYGAFTGS